MFDVWCGDINFTTLILMVSIVIILPVQLLLCFTVKSRAIRLLPIIILSVLIGIFVIMAITINDLRAVGYVLLAVYAGFMTFACGIGWGIWAIAKKIKKKN